MRQVLNYNEKKVASSDAKILFAAGFPRDPATMSLKNKMDVFTTLTRQNQRTKANTLHISLNFSPKDNLDKVTLINIARDYLKAIGLEKQPYLIYQHLDAGHPHLHIASVIIDHAGKRIETFDIDIRKPMALRDALENKYKLTKMKSHRINQKDLGGGITSYDTNYSLNRDAGQPLQLERIAYGSVETRTAICSIVPKVVKNYKFGSLGAFNAILNQFGVMADRGRPGSHLYQVGGLLYRLLDEKNQPIGTPVKASKINSRPTLKNLENRIVLNEYQNGSNKQRIRYLLDKALLGQNPGVRQNPDRQQEDLDPEAYLRKNGIRIIFRENQSGKIVGVTYIDNAAYAAFKDEELGKEYSAEAVLKALHQKVLLKQQIPIQPASENTNRTAAHLNIQPPWIDPGSQSVSPIGKADEYKNQPVHETPITLIQSAYPASTLPVIQISTDTTYNELTESNSQDLTQRQGVEDEQQQEQQQQEQQLQQQHTRVRLSR
ncbi:hypothetical protein GCM10027566_39060 [Arachidicoccus ginsenosidivorans]